MDGVTYGGESLIYRDFKGKKLSALGFGCMRLPCGEQGEADVLLAFEQLEAVRYMNMVRPGGTVVVNTQTIAPMPVITGAAEYPEDLMDTLANAGLKVVAVDALALAKKAGNARTVNTALMGALACQMEVPEEMMLETLARIVPAKTIEVNQTAFRLGYEG